MIRQKYTPSLSALHDLKPGTKINLVLSGGGEKGVAHIALLEKIEELKLEINHISATSAGTLVGSMYASGLSCQEILNFFKTTPLFNFSWINIQKPGIFDADNYEDLLKDLVAFCFEDLKIPLTVSTTNLEQGYTRYFSEGLCMLPILASCAVPAVFTPIEIEGELYGDGGIMDNFPITPFLDDDTPIVGSYLGVPNLKTQDSLDTTYKLSMHSAALLSHAVEEWKFFRTHVTLTYPLADFDPFDMKEVNGIYTTAQNYLAQK